jgi:hypothetical protein
MSEVSICAEDFINSLKEVQLIINRAVKHQQNPREYEICVKSALLFLVSKFETFLEDLVQSYIHIIENKKLPPHLLPEAIKLHSLDNLVDDKFISDVRNHKPRALISITKISKLCVGDELIDNITIDKGFDYGKHGEKAIVHLFSRIGIEDIFSLCDLYELQDTLLGKTKVKINIIADINSITNHRNNILHNDLTPNVTHDQIFLYKKHLVQFSKRICNILEFKLANLAVVPI